MPEEHVVTGLEDVVLEDKAKLAADEAALAAAEAAQVSPVAAPVETAAEKAFAEPIKILEPVESAAAKGNRELYERILAARKIADNPPPPKKQPVAPAILSQTQREMAEGARISARHAAQQAYRPPPTPRDVAAQGSSVPVFRPQDFVPGMNKGNVNAQPVT
jgi:hypothetical protein